MKFTPKSEREIAEANLLPEGVYDFEVTEAEDRVSQSGNEMIFLRLRCFSEDGRNRLVDDYLLEKIEYKLRHAAEAMGLLDKYESGYLAAEDFLGRGGKVKIIIQKDKAGQYADKNAVRDYVTEGDIPAHVASKANGQAPQDDLSDEIPF